MGDVGTDNEELGLKLAVKTSVAIYSTVALAIDYDLEMLSLKCTLKNSSSYIMYSGQQMSSYTW